MNLPVFNRMFNRRTREVGNHSMVFCCTSISKGIKILVKAPGGIFRGILRRDFSANPPYLVAEYPWDSQPISQSVLSSEERA